MKEADRKKRQLKKRKHPDKRGMKETDAASLSIMSMAASPLTILHRWDMLYRTVLNNKSLPPHTPLSQVSLNEVRTVLENQRSLIPLN